MTIFTTYAKYYDLLYRDKDYHKETTYIDHLLRQYAPGARTLLELGSGTGKHAHYLAQAGYVVHGIDRSREMLRQAEQLRAQQSESTASRLSFSQGDMRTLRLDQQFDAILSLFHVMSYQTSNDDLRSVFETVSTHLNPGGVFIFDCWYGPGVLTDPPRVCIKRIEDDEIAITRLSEPIMYARDNCVEVNYQVFVRTKETGAVEEIHECHRMRYLFTPEIEHYLTDAQLALVGTYASFSNDQPDYNSWYAHFIGKAL